jgi:hypothetical protein
MLSWTTTYEQDPTIKSNFRTHLDKYPVVLYIGDTSILLTADQTVKVIDELTMSLMAHDLDDNIKP